MKSNQPSSDLTDPSPVFNDMSNEELLDRFKWFNRLNNPVFFWLSDCLSPLTKIFPEWSYSWLVKRTIYKFFVGGSSLEECIKTIDKLYEKGVGSVPDLSVESVSSEKKIESAIEKILQTITLSHHNPKKVPFTVFKMTALLEKEIMMAISKKLKYNIPLDNFLQNQLNLLLQRVDRLCSQAHRLGVHIMIDAEETWIQDAIDFIAIKMMKKYNLEKAIVLNTYQMYLKEGFYRLNTNLEKAKNEKFYLGIKLVRGAYMEKERERAFKYNYDSPINPSKELTDLKYDNALELCLDNITSISLLVGTHNQKSIEFMTNLMDKNHLERNIDNIYFSQLFGMGDLISFNLSKRGFNVCKYLPFGPVKEVVPYLTRRARENSSIKGFGGNELKNISMEVRRRKLCI